MAGVGGELLVGAGRVVTNEAVDVRLGREVELVVLPAEADVARRAARFVGRQRAAEVVDDVLLAEFLTGLGVGLVPSPVKALVNLLRRLGMTAETGLGHVRSGRERPLEFLELAVVGGRDLP
jgi:hypothetical protein